jgi:hypothetical protein
MRDDFFPKCRRAKKYYMLPAIRKTVGEYLEDGFNGIW